MATVPTGKSFAGVAKVDSTRQERATVVDKVELESLGLRVISSITTRRLYASHPVTASAKTKRRYPSIDDAWC